MNTFNSGFAGLIDKYIWYRNASGCWNKTSEDNLRYFDNYCAKNYKDSTLVTQSMVDGWCSKRETETSCSCYGRTFVVKSFIIFLRDRGLTNVRAPEVTHTKNVKYIPHAFTSMELHNFFKACDSIDLKYNRLQSKLRKLQCPVFFRLLYSSGIRTTEARFLRVQDVDLSHGVLDIKKSKGYDQHYVALHETMTDLLQRYESAIQKIQANRTYFFETSRGTHFSRDWVEDNFTALWKSANGNTGHVVAYELRHNYATENINSWENDPFAASENLHFLSKSMGHRWIQSTFYYYSIVPALADKISQKTESGLNKIIPEVWDEE